MDTVDKETRSRIMSRNRHKDSNPEKILRSALHSVGLRFKLHDKKLPGKPDLVFPRYHATVFVHGCFWHSHGCHRSSKPKSNIGYWHLKLKRNHERDAHNITLLLKLNWRVMIVWECALLGTKAISAEILKDRISAWLKGKEKYKEVPLNKSLNGLT